MQLCVQLFLFCFMIEMWRKECSNMKNDHLLVFLAVWVLFPLVFGQVKEWLILKFQEMIRVLHEVACPIRFYFDLWSG